MNTTVTQAQADAINADLTKRWGPGPLVRPTKPPPPPPKFRQGRRLIEPREFSIPTKQLERYKLPMRSEYLPAWKAILQECNYPQAVIVIDFETYFDEEYRMMRGNSADGLTTVEYVMDPRFEILGVSIFETGDQPFKDYETNTNFWCGEEVIASHFKYLQGKYGENLEGCTVVMQNAAFDGLILSTKYNIHPPYVIDVLGLARHWNSRTKNDLDTLAKRYSLPQKGKTEEFKGLTFRRRMKKTKSRKKGPKLPVQVPIATDEQVKALATYANNDGMREWELFTILLPKLSNPSVELRIMQHTLELFWKPTLAVDFERGTQLIADMQAEITKSVASCGVTNEQISGDKSFSALIDAALTEAGDDPAKYYKQGKRGPLLAIAQTDPERELLEKHENEKVRSLMQARIGLESWPKHIVRVQRIMRMAKAMNGLLPVPLKYCGAHTGRASGGEKINLQNLGSRGHELVNAVRELIVAVPGQKLVIADASQIEARVLAWIAGQWDLVQKFAANEEIYCGFASKVLGYPVRKPRKSGGIPAVEARMKWARNAIGKIGVLGCGYGMGTDKIFAMGDGQFDYETAEKIKTTYRSENQEIVRFWSDIERAFIYTAKYGKACEMPRGLRFDQAEDCDVIITLPNGRELHYHKVRITTDDRGRDTIEVWNDTEHHWGHVWGGHLTENVVQAMSRDILMEAMLRLEAKHHTALHVHDEVVAPVPEAVAEDALKDAITELSRRPTWARDCPLAAEGMISDHYTK